MSKYPIMDSVVSSAWSSARKARKSYLRFKAKNQYTGADRSTRSMRNWRTVKRNADDDILPDLDALIERSRDLEKNNPLASGILKTKLTNVVGSGFKFHSRINRDILNLSEGQADAWESTTEQEFRLFWNSKNVDIAKTSNGAEQTRMVYSQKNLNGGALVILPKVPLINRPYNTRIQVIEVDRLSNPHNTPDTDTLAGGIETDKYGAPIAYHIAEDDSLITGPATKWQRIEAFAPSTGLPNILHVYHKKRPGQSRGVPDLHAIVEHLKLLGKYTTSEQIAADISSAFTVFIETPDGDGKLDWSDLADDTGQVSSDKDIKLEPGLIVDLAKGEKVHDSNPGRPNANFDQFCMSILKQIAIGVELPYEIVVKHFSTSYSAARAAFLEAWKYYTTERNFIIENFLNPVFEVFLWEAIANGRISAPGFLTDPLIRSAYLECQFIGAAKGHIDEEKEINAAAKRIENKISTVAQETAEITGGDWDKNHKQQVKERKRMLADGLIEKEQVNAIKKPV